MCSRILCLYALNQGKLQILHFIPFEVNSSYKIKLLNIALSIKYIHSWWYIISGYDVDFVVHIWCSVVILVNFTHIYGAKNERSWQSQVQAFHDARSFAWVRRLRAANLSVSRTIDANMQIPFKHNSVKILKKMRKINQTSPLMTENKLIDR